MNVQPIGLITLLIGFACLLFGSSFSVTVLIWASLLGSAAALQLGAGGQVQPAHLLLAFVVPAVFCRRQAVVVALRCLKFPNAAFWLAWTVVFAIATAFLVPRLLAGATEINAIPFVDSQEQTLTIPLAPVGGNFTQSIYMIADLICFVLITVVCSTKEGLLTVSKALIVFAGLNIAFAALDLATFYTNTVFILDGIRNASYQMHLDEVTSGLKRIAGSFSETSSFSTATLGILGYTGTLWIYERWSLVTGGLTVASIVLLMLSTSSTAIAAGFALFVTLYVTAILRSVSGQGWKTAQVFVLGVPLFLTVLVFALLLSPTASVVVGDYLNNMIFDKASSQSGVDRAAWNAQAIQNVIDTYGIGAGLGTVRASSFIVAMFANLGITGAALFICFFWRLLRLPFRQNSFEGDLRAAGRNGCLGILLALSVSGALVDLGLEFYVLAGLATASPLAVAWRAATEPSLVTADPRG